MGNGRLLTDLGLEVVEVRTRGQRSDIGESNELLNLMKSF